MHMRTAAYKYGHFGNGYRKRDNIDAEVMIGDEGFKQGRSVERLK